MRVKTELLRDNRFPKHILRKIFCYYTQQSKAFNIMIKTVFSIFLYTTLFLSGCSPFYSSEEVVSISEVKNGAFSELTPEERDTIHNLRKISAQSPSNASYLAEEATRIYSVEDFLTTYPEYAKQANVNYKVGSHDIISITIYDEGDLTREAVRVSGEGKITFPLIGRLHVEGLTTGEIEDLMSQKLAEGQYLLDAQITVMIQAYESKKYSVLGAVKKSGIFEYKAQEKLLDAICLAGGVDFDTAGDKAIITRSLPIPQREKTTTTTTVSNNDPDKIVIHVDLEKLFKGNDNVSNIPLLESDSIYIPEAEFYYILGEVNSPGSYKIVEKNMTIVEAIGTAGGFTPIANKRKTRIIRVEDHVEKVITVNVNAITNAGKKIQDVIIEPGDIIVVPESFF